MNIFLFVILVFMSLFLILGHIFKAPSLRQSKTIKKSAMKKEKTNYISLAVDGIAGSIYRLIPVSPVSAIKLSNALNSVSMNMSVKRYLATPVAYMILLTPVIIGTYFLHPIICGAIFLIAVIIFVKEYNYVYDLQRDKKTQIESELLQFTSLISHSIKNDRDILRLLDKFKEATNSYFNREINITVADMRSGNYESALKHLETRVGSIHLSEVIRGLISANNGIDTVNYFENLVMKFTELEKQRLQAIANSKKPKIARMTFAVMMCFLGFVFTILGSVLAENLKTLFS